MKIHRLLILIIFFSIGNIANAQIIVETIFDKDLRIEILDNGDIYNFKIRILDSITSNKNYSGKLERLNTEFYISSKKNGYQSKETKLTGKKIADLKYKNTFFSFYESSIMKSDYHEYTDLVDEIYQTKNEELNGEDENLIILHGQPIKITISHNGSERIIINNASAKSNYPLTTELIENTLQILREKKIITTDKRKTCGY